MERIYLSRRNLLTLLNKLDRVKKGEESACTIIKKDNVHPVYPQSMSRCEVIAIEDADYYIDRPPGFVHPSDEPSQNDDGCDDHF